MTRVLLLFVDGVGLGSDDADVNPLVRARLSTLTGLLDGCRATMSEAPQHAERASVVPVDAVLGFEGTPQSGTGQASLLTGRNAVALHGRHFGPWIPSRLRGLVSEENVLSQALRAGHTAAFANAYPEEVKGLINGKSVRLPSDAPGLPPDVPPNGPFDGFSGEPPGSPGSPGSPADPHSSTRGRGRRGMRGSMFLRAGPPLAAIGAGLLTRHTPELERGDAVASELTNEGWRERLGRTQLPEIDAVHAGRNLARVAVQHDLTLFAHYATDYAGHQQDMGAAVRVLERLDAFLGGLLEARDEELVVFVVSDHGNIEDVRTGHTRNPALGVVIGPGHERIASRMHSLTDITPVILDILTNSRR